MARVSAEKKAEGARWLAQGRSAEWVGQLCGVTERTVRAWRRNDPEFRRVYEQQLGGLRSQGLLAIAEQRQTPPPLRKKQDETTLEALGAAALKIGRKEADRGR
ncbi:hypothetical protein EJ357_22675 [Streptomyces cyaneochromogenes]|uniref:Uncharacterized protein n=1 Tax=Streptomyces cyaneochromogenes TaxID=2496836 RepID=A0A3S9MA61_9ACTN|nr:hypothetical protein [Streptomyces cyaneochromogenes]AZQ35938.1 hypothetical protein EJ357_22675 [Streptomyces cyaneochromogenes]